MMWWGKKPGESFHLIGTRFAQVRETSIHEIHTNLIEWGKKGVSAFP